MTDERTVANDDALSRLKKDRPEGVVHNSFALLRVLGKARRPVGVTGLAASVGIPKTTAHRLLEQMAREGVVVRRDRKWALGKGLSSLTQARPRLADDLVDVAEPRMHALTQATGASVVLFMRSEDSGPQDTVERLSRTYGPLVGHVMTAEQQREAAVDSASAIWRALTSGELTAEYHEVHPECDCIAMPLPLPSGATALLGLARHKNWGVESLKRPLDRMGSLILSDLRRLELSDAGTAR